MFYQTEEGSGRLRDGTFWLRETLLLIGAHRQRFIRAILSLSPLTRREQADHDDFATARHARTPALEHQATLKVHRGRLRRCFVGSPRSSG